MECLFQKAYRSLSEHICVNNLEQAFTKEFGNLDCHLARVDYLLKMAEPLQLLNFPASRTVKSLPKAMSLKVAGNKLFQQKKYRRALNTYSEALRLVPMMNNDGLLAICFANRSAALFGLEQYSDCLSDIRLAINAGYPDESLYKLLVRKAKCHQYVETESLNASINNAFESIDKSCLTSTSKQPWKDELAQLVKKPYDKFLATEVDFDASEGYSALCSSATVSENNEFGRFVQAVENINSGDVVLVEKPFCSVTLSESYLTHCCNCQVRVDFKSYPCRTCADVVYCGRECEELSWQHFHQFECDYILTIKGVNVNMGHLSLRSGLLAGYSVVKNALINGVNPNSKSYGNIYSLQGHEMERSGKDMFWRTVAAVVLAHMCDIKQWAQEQDAPRILAAIVLHHMDTFPCNAHEISEIIYDEDEPFKSALVEIGAGIYQTLSMFNHSCDPSVVRTFYKGNTCVMNALSPIQKLDQIYDNYGCLYATHSLNDRLSKLRTQYYFECCCLACVHNWPLYDGLEYRSQPLYKCSHCYSAILPPYEDNCDNCMKAFNKTVVDEMLVKSKQSFDVLLGQLFVSKGVKRADLASTAKKLQDYSQLVNQMVFRPYKTLNDCQEALKHVYTRMGNCALRN